MWALIPHFCPRNAGPRFGSLSLEARVTLEQEQLIARAAALRGSSVTEFIVASAQQGAAETIKDFEILSLHDKARDVFVDAVLHPPGPNEAARKAARRYMAQIGR